MRERGTETKGKSLPYLPGVDLIRFFAALMVVVFHLGYSIWANPQSGLGSFRPDGYQLLALEHFAWIGWVGVEVFFVISGYVIVSSANGRTAFGFLRSRMVRLYPAAWVGTLACLMALLSLGVPFSADLLNRLVRSILLFPVHPWIDPVYWTLAVEIVFYSLVFLLMISGSFGKIAIFALGLSVWSMGYNFLDLAHALFPGLPKFHDIGLQASRLSLLSYGVFFSLGMFIWLVRARGWTVSSALGTLFSILGCMTEVYVHALRVDTQMALAGMDIGAVAWLPVLVWSALTIVLTASTYWTGDARGKFGRWARRLGLMTYPLYLVHFTLGTWALTYFVPLHGNFVSLLMAIGVVVTISFVLAEYIEPSLKRWLDSVLTRAEKAPALQNWAGLMTRRELP